MSLWQNIISVSMMFSNKTAALRNHRNSRTWVWETHLCNAFRAGLLSHLSQAVNKSCIDTNGARLEELRHHATHAQKQYEKTNDIKTLSIKSIWLWSRPSLTHNLNPKVHHKVLGGGFSTGTLQLWETSTWTAPPQTRKHSFLLSSVCPVNILGRDLILAFGSNLLSTPDGLVVSRSDFTHIFFKWYFSWWGLICVSMAYHPSRSLVTLASQRVSPQSHFMTALHHPCFSKSWSGLWMCFSVWFEWFYSNVHTLLELHAQHSFWLSY